MITGEFSYATTFRFPVFSNRATAKEILPTLPQYIRKIIMSLLRGRRSRVIPMVIPAVPIAEKVSNKTSVRAKGWIAQMATAPTRASKRLVYKTAVAFFKASSPMLRPKALALRSRRMPDSAWSP